jgi:hypothetical protein
LNSRIVGAERTPQASALFGVSSRSGSAIGGAGCGDRHGPLSAAIAVRTVTGRDQESNSQDRACIGQCVAPSRGRVLCASEVTWW